MNILVVMIPLSILLLIGALVAFFWAVDHDQFDDLDTPGLLPLLDDPNPKHPAPTAIATADSDGAPNATAAAATPIDAPPQGRADNDTTQPSP
ncbi:MAG: cbb3-type cytochrome oxidase assembly protein CcoS [Proteobacteria bacterium]|nr:cbb3-type cytochrome oxidase assembly protein CcoS [Pseudomonadota bacterium]